MPAIAGSTYAISQTIGPGVNIQDPAVLNTVIAMVNERIDAVPFLGAGSPAYLSRIPYVRPGDDLQGCWHLIQCQIALGKIAPFFFNTSISLGGSSAYYLLGDPRIASTTSPSDLTYAGHTLATLRAAAGLPAVTTASAQSGDLAASIVANYSSSGYTGCAFRARTYRLIQAVSDTQDVFGNAATTGQYARMATRFSGMQPGLYRYSGSAWVQTLDQTQRPDIVDNTQAAPNYYPTIGWATVASQQLLPTPPIDGGPYYAQSGDIVSANLWNEIRLIANQMSAVWYGYLDRLPNPSWAPNYMGVVIQSKQSSVNQTSLATLQGDWSSNTAPVYTAAGHSWTGDLPPMLYQSQVINFGGVHYNAFATAGTFYIGSDPHGAGSGLLPSNIHKSVDWYRWAAKPIGASGSLTVTNTWDAQGTGLRQNQWNAMSGSTTPGYASGASVSGGQIDPIPPNFPSAPSSSAETFLGCYLPAHVAIVTYRFQWAF